MTVLCIYELPTSIAYAYPRSASKFIPRPKMTILSNHRLHSYKATASSHRRILTPKKTPVKSSSICRRRRIIITFPLTEKAYTITNKLVKTIDSTVKVEEPVTLSIEEMNIYEDMYGGWNPSLYNEINIEYDLDNSADYEDYLTEADNEEAWAHLDYIEWLGD